MLPVAGNVVADGIDARCGPVPVTTIVVGTCGIVDTGSDVSTGDKVITVDVGMVPVTILGGRVDIVVVAEQDTGCWVGPVTQCGIVEPNVRQYAGSVMWHGFVVDGAGNPVVTVVGGLFTIVTGSAMETIGVDGSAVDTVEVDGSVTVVANEVVIHDTLL
jgi:hypothetical protein